MADLYSQYASGTQFTAGTIAGSTMGTSGINPIVDRLNIVTGSALYWSIPGVGFMPQTPDVNDVAALEGVGGWLISTGNIDFTAPVVLPGSATITEVEVFGNAGATGQDWKLSQTALSTTGSTYIMAGSLVNSSSATIGSSLVDNNSFSYNIFVNQLATNDRLYGARIKYTLEET